MVATRASHLLAGSVVALGSRWRTVLRLWLAAAVILVLPCSRAVAEDVFHEHLGLQLSGRLEVSPGRSIEKDGVVLILHGTLAHNGMEIIRDLQTNLKQRGLNTLAVTLSLGLDQRTGMFDCNLEHDHRHADAVDELAAWVEWLKQKGASRVDFIGHSRGGAQVALFAAEVPDKVSGRVVLVAPLLETSTPAETAARYAAQFGTPLEPLLERARKDVSEEAKLLEVPGFLHCRNARVSAAAFLDYYSGARPPVPELLKKVEAPTLVVAAGSDEIAPGVVDTLKGSGLPRHVKVAEMDGADHFFRDLYGEDLADEIAAFLRRD